MASKNNKKGKATSLHSTPYVIAALMLAIITIVNVILVTNLFLRSAKISKTTSGAMEAVNKMNTEILTVNNNTLQIIAGVNTMSNDRLMSVAQNISTSFMNIEEAADDFENMEGVSDAAKSRFKHAHAVVGEYNNILKGLRAQFMEQDPTSANGVVGTKAFGDDDNAMMNMFTQDIYPLQVTASEMLKATQDLVTLDTADATQKNTQLYIVIEVVMVLIAIAGEIVIYIIAKMAKKARLELEERERSLAEVDAKLKTTRQKASDLAVMNVLTGMKNRYSLDNEISERLDSDRFSIAVFDLDNFRSINDTYGYDFGDEYLALVAEKLKEEFGSVAEIYNITGNEFCFVFNKDISEGQAMGTVQRIQAVMTSSYEVLNLAVQLPCSGAIYHYLPGDCLNVNSLLVKLDTTMRAAKMNGGNMINTVMNI